LIFNILFNPKLALLTITYKTAIALLVKIKAKEDIGIYQTKDLKITLIFLVIMIVMILIQSKQELKLLELITFMIFC